MRLLMTGNINNVIVAVIWLFFARILCSNIEGKQGTSFSSIKLQYIYTVFTLYLYRLRYYKHL